MAPLPQSRPTCQHVRAVPGTSFPTDQDDGADVIDIGTLVAPSPFVREFMAVKEDIYARALEIAERYGPAAAEQRPEHVDPAPDPDLLLAHALALAILPAWYLRQRLEVFRRLRAMVEASPEPADRMGKILQASVGMLTGMRDRSLDDVVRFSEAYAKGQRAFLVVACRPRSPVEARFAYDLAPETRATLGLRRD